MQRTVTLVDESGVPTGTADLGKAHDGEGMLHRAFSAYVFRQAWAEILIQRRAPQKRLWAGFWANTCCSHPFEHESPADAAGRRLREELGLSCALRPVGTLLYHAIDPSGRGAEYEHVTLLVGQADPGARVCPDPAEVSEYRWADVAGLLREMAAGDAPARFAPWFLLGLPAVLKRHVPGDG